VGASRSRAEPTARPPDACGEQSLDTLSLANLEQVRADALSGDRLTLSYGSSNNRMGFRNGDPDDARPFTSKSIVDDRCAAPP
jgi:hypothetical protein